MSNAIPTELSVNGKNYSVIKLLGKGKGGYSYLASDGTNQYVLKQIHHEPCSYYQFGNKYIILLPYWFPSISFHLGTANKFLS